MLGRAATKVAALPLMGALLSLVRALPLLLLTRLRPGLVGFGLLGSDIAFGCGLVLLGLSLAMSQLVTRKLPECLFGLALDVLDDA